jgi:hypothetical protein
MLAALSTNINFLKQGCERNAKVMLYIKVRFINPNLKSRWSNTIKKYLVLLLESPNS